MSLRNQVSERIARYHDPVKGVNLRESAEDVDMDESPLMQNCIYLAGVRNRLGSLRLTPATLDATKRIRGGHKFYYGGSSPAKKRLVAYDTEISVIADNGTETVLDNGMTSDLDTQFTTWSITDKVYIANGTDTMRDYDGTTFQTTAGTNIPVPRWIAPIADRLMAITTAGIERTSPRTGTVWSANSTWATFRPSLTGLFTCIHPVNLREGGVLNAGLLAFQPNAYYLITGTDFGSDASAGSASAGEDGDIQLIDPGIGTSSPFTVCTIPGVGTAWLTSDRNVYLLPEGSMKGMYIGDKLQSNGAVVGLESLSIASLSQASMVYFDRYLMLTVPVGGNSYSSVQFWMDMYSFVLYPDRGPVWYGPMTGQTVGRMWVENQQSDFAVYGGENNPSTGAFVYSLRSAARYTDAVGLVDNNVSMLYQTPYNPCGAAAKLKYLRSVHFDLQLTTGSPTCNVYDLDGAVLTGATVEVVSE